MSPSNYHHLGSSTSNPHISDGRIVAWLQTWSSWLNFWPCDLCSFSTTYKKPKIIRIGTNLHLKNCMANKVKGNASRTRGRKKVTKTSETATLWLSLLPKPFQSEQVCTPELLCWTDERAPAGMARPKPITTARGMAHLCILRISVRDKNVARIMVQ